MNAQNMPGPYAAVSPWGLWSYWRGQSSEAWQVEDQPTAGLVEPEDQATRLSCDRKKQHVALRHTGAPDLGCILWLMTPDLGLRGLAAGADA